MSGRRQHHLPMFLQKGFLSKKKKKQFYTYVFTKDRSPFETNLINVGLEIYFYGNSSESEADENITNNEIKYAEFVEGLRQKTENSFINSLECANLIGHMQIRAKNTRESIHEIGEAFLRGAKEKFDGIDDPEVIVRHLIKTQRKKIAKKIREKLPAHLNDNQKFLLTKHCLDNPKEWIAKLTPESWRQFLNGFGMFIEKLPNLVKDSHNQSLEKTTVAHGFVKTCQKFQWKLYNIPKENLIFGDVGAIGRFKPNDEFKNLMFVNENLECVYMPISSMQILVGCNKTENFYLPNTFDINKAIAKLSREFFISSFNNQETQHLSSLIGRKSSMIGDEERDLLANKLRHITPK